MVDDGFTINATVLSSSSDKYSFVCQAPGCICKLVFWFSTDWQDPITTKIKIGKIKDFMH
jgi:hypothetical protein